MADRSLDRRAFLRAAAGAGAAAFALAGGAACGSGSPQARRTAASKTGTGQAQKTPEEAVRAAEAEIKPIFEKWRKQGKI